MSSVLSKRDTAEKYQGQTCLDPCAGAAGIGNELCCWATSVKGKTQTHGSVLAYASKEIFCSKMGERPRWDAPR